MQPSTRYTERVPPNRVPPVCKEILTAVASTAPNEEEVLCRWNPETPELALGLNLDVRPSIGSSVGPERGFMGALPRLAFRFFLRKAVRVTSLSIADWLVLDGKGHSCAVCSVTSEARLSPTIPNTRSRARQSDRPWRQRNEVLGGVAFLLVSLELST